VGPVLLPDRAVVNVRGVPSRVPDAPEVPVPETPQTDAPVLDAPAVEEPLVEESLVEEVSIDGMCGVY
jgi:mycofactocin precursor